MGRFAPLAMQYAADLDGSYIQAAVMKRGIAL